MINLLFSGDFAPLQMTGKGPDPDFSAIKGLLEGCDLHITNLECPITSEEKQIPKSGPTLKADPRGVDILKSAGVGLVCMANNHIFDYGEKGLSDTIDICRGSGMKIVGIVSVDGDSTEKAIYEFNGVRIGFINYCEHEFSVREKGLTGACGYDPVDAFNDIRKMKGEADRVIIIYHGGNEYYPLPRPDLKKDFHFLADAGADAVVGHHTHVISGIENYMGKPLVYSLGNFFFPYDGEPESWNRGLLCLMKLGDSVTVELLPVIQCKDGPRVEIPDVAEAEGIQAEINMLSQIISDDTELAKSWDNYTSMTGMGLANQVLYPTAVDKLMRRLPLLRRQVNDPARLRSLVNILRCKSLEQLLIGNLKSRKW